MFLKTYSDDVTVICPSTNAPRSGYDRGDSNIKIVIANVTAIVRHEAMIEVLSSSERIEFDVVYPALGSSAQSTLATGLGAKIDDDGALLVDKNQQTSITGLYAAGDVVSELDQITVAFGHAAVAATHIHNTLLKNFRSPIKSLPPYDKLPSFPWNT